VSMIILGRYFFLIFSKISRANFSKKIIFVKYKKILPPSRLKPGQPGHAQPFRDQGHSRPGPNNREAESGEAE
jgi:hypothetical protein